MTASAPFRISRQSAWCAARSSPAKHGGAAFDPAKKRVRHSVESSRRPSCAAHGSAFALHLDEFERIEGLIAALEARRAAALREIGFHRADFADRLAAATQPAPIEDAEFAEVTSPGEAG